MFSGRKKSRFSVIHPIILKRRYYYYFFRIIQVLSSLAVTVMFYCVPSEERVDVVTETCYPGVTMLLFFRILTKPSAKVSFYYNLYVNTVALAIYSVRGTLDLYYGLKRPPTHIYLHYARLYTMLFVGALVTGDTLYIEFFETDGRLLREAGSIGDAARARAENALRKYKEQMRVRKEEEGRKKEEELQQTTSKEPITKKQP